MPPPPHAPTLFPYTTLFRSRRNPDQIDFRTQPEQSALAIETLWQLPTLLHQNSSQLDRFGGKLKIESLAPAKRSEEHTSELQSRGHLVCRLLLEKKNNTHNN